MSTTSDTREIEAYTRSLCHHLRVDYGSVVKRGKTAFKTPERVVRHLVIRKFSGVLKHTEIADFFHTDFRTISHTKQRYNEVYAYSPAFQKAIQYLQEVGAIDITPPPATSKISKQLDLTLHHIERLTTML